MVLIRFITRLNHSYWEQNVCLEIQFCKCLVSNLTDEQTKQIIMSNVHTFKLWIAQLQVGEYLKDFFWRFNG